MEHNIILCNDLSSLHYTRKYGDSKGVYRRHTLKDRRKKHHDPLNNRQQGEVFSLYRISFFKVILLGKNLKQVY